jgi:hypothetical protein
MGGAVSDAINHIKRLIIGRLSNTTLGAEEIHILLF